MNPTSSPATTTTTTNITGAHSSYTAAVSSLTGLSAESRSLLVRSAEVEELASEILWRKNQLTEFDRLRQEATQALATLREKKKSSMTSATTTISTPASASVSTITSTSTVAPPPSVTPSSYRTAAHPPRHLWVSRHSNFVSLPRTAVSEMLLTDRSKLDTEIDRIRSEMKELMKRLQSIQASQNIPKGLLDFALK